MPGYQKFLHIGLALDPIHVGAGGARLGRVELTIVRDPVTRVPKIPGSSLAGVYRTYVAMEEHERNPNRQVNGEPRPYYPHCAGLGQPRGDHYLGHCARPDCPVCTVFGFARGRDQAGGFAGLAAFTDAHVLLFPVPTRRGPHWATCPDALRLVGLEVRGVDQNAVYLNSSQNNPPQNNPPQNERLNLGWLLLPVEPCAQFDNITNKLESLQIPPYILEHLALVPDRLFPHIVNSNLEVRTSVAINPATGAAEEQALFSYEALPRGTVLAWEIITKNPQHFQIEGQSISAVSTPDEVHRKVQLAHPYLEHLGVGGMGTRGMGRLKVLFADQSLSTQTVSCSASSTSATSSPSGSPAPSAGDAAASSSGTTE